MGKGLLAKIRYCISSLTFLKRVPKEKTSSKLRFIIVSKSILKSVLFISLGNIDLEILFVHMY